MKRLHFLRLFAVVVTLASCILNSYCDKCEPEKDVSLLDGYFNITSTSGTVEKALIKTKGSLKADKKSDVTLTIVEKVDGSNFTPTKVCLKVKCASGVGYVTVKPPDVTTCTTPPGGEEICLTRSFVAAAAMNLVENPCDGFTKVCFDGFPLSAGLTLTVTYASACSCRAVRVKNLNIKACVPK